MLYFFKAFEGIYKNNKALVSLIFFGLLVFFGYASGFLLSSAGTLATHETRIEANENSIASFEEQTKYIVRRASFNAYIKRKDDELLQQIELNNDISAKLGFLTGELFMIDEKFKLTPYAAFVTKVNP